MIKNCSVCGTSFEPLKAHGEYCGKPCRDKAYRQRKGAERPSLARSATPGARCRTTTGKRSGSFTGPLLRASSRTGLLSQDGAGKPTLRIR